MPKTVLPIVHVVLYAVGPHRTVFDTKVTLKRFRSDKPVEALLEAEWGLQIAADRIRFMGSRRFTLTAASSSLFSVMLTPEELSRCEVQRFGDILAEQEVDWSSAGMVAIALLSHQVQHLADVPRPA